MSQTKPTSPSSAIQIFFNGLDGLWGRFISFLQKEFWSVMLFICLALGICGIFLHNETEIADPQKFDWEILGNGLMLAGACFFAGGLGGFLFGIPRTVQSGQASQPNDEVDYRINTNLEQISDWLTKIIVGLTLVNLHEIPKFFEKLANDMKSGMGGADSDVVFAGGIMVYFLILGFLAGYISTRTQLSSLFSRADASLLFSRRDTDLLRTIAEMFEAGKALTEEETKELQAQIMKASLLTQNSIFAYTKNCRKIFHKRRQADKVGLTIPVFYALVEADYEGLNHQFRGQLGYAYKDKLKGDSNESKAEDYKNALEILSAAIAIRGDWRSKGYGVYELNWAISKIELLRLTSTDKQPSKQIAEEIIRHFEVAWQSGESYKETIRTKYPSWVDGGKIKAGNIREEG